MKKQIFSAWKCTPAIGKPEVRYFVLKMWTWKFSMFFPPQTLLLSSVNSVAQSQFIWNAVWGKILLLKKTSAGSFPTATKALDSSSVLPSFLLLSTETWGAENLNGEICSFISLFLPRSLLPNTCRWSPLPQIPGPSYIHKEGVKMEGRTVIRKSKYG